MYNLGTDIKSTDRAWAPGGCAIQLARNLQHKIWGPFKPTPSPSLFYFRVWMDLTAKCQINNWRRFRSSVCVVQIAELLPELPVFLIMDGRERAAFSVSPTPPLPLPETSHPPVTRSGRPLLHNAHLIAWAITGAEIFQLHTRIVLLPRRSGRGRAFNSISNNYYKMNFNCHISAPEIKRCTFTFCQRVDF